MLTPAEAEAAIAANLGQPPVEVLPLSQCAGRILRQPVHAERDAPPFDRVAMDGIALSHASWRAGRREFQVTGEQRAGQPPLSLAQADQCLEVMTGAVLPLGADLVIPIEHVELDGNCARLRDDIPRQQWEHVHRQAADARAGDLLLAPGATLRGPEVAIAASAGLAAVSVSRRWRIAVISTGDELVEPGAAILSHQVRRSNSHAIEAALHLAGINSTNRFALADDFGQLQAGLATALQSHDALVISGGVSAGRRDYVPAALESLGVSQVFHKVAQRPGKPLWFGMSATGRAVFALPGNPVSVLVCLVRYVIPAVMRAEGSTGSGREQVSLAEAIEVAVPLSYFVPVSLEYDESGIGRARPRPTQGSGDFNALAGTAGFVELSPGPGRVAAGTAVPLYRW